MNVKTGDDDEIGTFIFRTNGFNSIRTLAARLSYCQALSGNHMACLPLELRLRLRLRGKSTTQSHRAPIYYVDLCVREGMPLNQAITQDREAEAARGASGYCQEAARAGFKNAAFEDSEEETPEIVEEFFQEGSTVASVAEPGANHDPKIAPLKTALKEKLGAQLNGTTRQHAAEKC